MRGLPDLKGKTIAVAVENAYVPFNSIDETTGKGVGWDYDVGHRNLQTASIVFAEFQASRLGWNLPCHGSRGI